MTKCALHCTTLHCIHLLLNLNYVLTLIPREINPLSASHVWHKHTVATEHVFLKKIFLPKIRNLCQDGRPAKFGSHKQQ